jgi:hypothetical protein
MHVSLPWWDKLTDVDLEKVAGKKAMLVARGQEQYRYTHERAQQEVDRRLQEYSDKLGPLGQVVSAIRCKRPHKMSRRASQRQLVRSKPKQRQRRSYVKETSCYIRRSCFGSLR